MACHGLLSVEMLEAAISTDDMRLAGPACGCAAVGTSAEALISWILVLLFHCLDAKCRSSANTYLLVLSFATASRAMRTTTAHG